MTFLMCEAGTCGLCPNCSETSFVQQTVQKMEAAEAKVVEFIAADEAKAEEFKTAVEERDALVKENEELKQQHVFGSLAEYERIRGPNIEELKTKALLEQRTHDELRGMEMRNAEWKTRLKAEERARSALVMLFEKERRESLLTIQQHERDKAELETRLFEMENRVKGILEFVMKNSGADAASMTGSFHPIQTQLKALDGDAPDRTLTPDP